MIHLDIYFLTLVTIAFGLISKFFLLAAGFKKASDTDSLIPFRMVKYGGAKPTVIMIKLQVHSNEVLQFKVKPVYLFDEVH